MSVGTSRQETAVSPSEKLRGVLVCMSHVYVSSLTSHGTGVKLLIFTHRIKPTLTSTVSFTVQYTQVHTQFRTYFLSLF